MDIKGVCYDTGRAYGTGFVTRQVFDPAMTRRELQIIRDDLHCNAVRFQGTDITRLMTAATAALELGGLQVWLSPELFKKSQAATIAYLARAGPSASASPASASRACGTPRLTKSSRLSSPRRSAPSANPSVAR